MDYFKKRGGGKKTKGSEKEASGIFGRIRKGILDQPQGEKWCPLCVVYKKRNAISSPD